LNDQLNTSGQEFVSLLASFPKNTFESSFARSATRLELAIELDRDELALLFDAALRARVCYIAFNGLGGCRGEIKPEREVHRIQLERDYMAARDAFFATSGWQSLLPARRGMIHSAFLEVSIRPDRLAW
jgi:hypothetical protein